MTALRKSVPGLAILACGLFAPGILAAQNRQPAEATSDAGSEATAPAGKSEAPSKKEKISAKAAPPASPRKKPDPRKIRVYLMDGSVIAGELSVDQIQVETEFGTLTVPVEKILGITPGLDSHDKLSARIDRLIRDLGSQDYKVREAAHKELLKLGPPVRDILARFRNDKDAERKRHVNELVEKLDEISQADEFDVFETDDQDDQKTWVRYDRVVTPNFTIAGSVNPSVFQVRSKYGALTISLNDIKRTERQHLEQGPTLKLFALDCNHLMLRSPKSCGIRLQAGDTVTVAATGRMAMPPWGSRANSGPNGNPQYGTNSIAGLKLYNGTLVARVGDSGKWIKVGSKAKFTASKAGVLKFGVAMRSSYSRSNYVFPGQYKLKIRVDPKE